MFGKANRVGTTCASRDFGPRQRRIWKSSNRYVPVPYSRGWARPDSNQRFYREIVAWKYVLHPNVVPFLGVSEVLFSFSIITPWLPNGNIADYVQKHEGVDRLQLVSDRRGLHKRVVRDFVISSLRKPLAASSTYIHWASYTATSLR